MSLTTAFTVFATKVARERRIPFEISADPFYAESNMEHLRRVIGQIESGEAVLKRHELIEPKG